MHSTHYLLSAALLATAAMAGPKLNPAHVHEGRSLMKRHFWCNGVDSETICPEGQTMVPIDQYACNTIAAAGRTGQISPPTNGESSTTCQGAPAPPPPAGNQGGQQPPSSSSTSIAPPPPPSPSPSNMVAGNIADNALEESKQGAQVEQPKQAAQVEPAKQAAQGQYGLPMQMMCTNAGGGDVSGSNGASFLLNCTIAA